MALVRMHAVVLLILLVVNAAQASDSAVLAFSATVLSRSQCKFNSANATLDFGTLDPTNPVDVPVTTTIGFVCRGSSPMATFFISDDDGLHETVPNGNRMQHETVAGAYLPYNLALSPVTDTVPKNSAQTLTITGTLPGASYQTALAGNYSDTVTITIAP